MTDVNPYRPSDSPVSDQDEPKKRSGFGIVMLLVLFTLGAGILSIAFGLLPILFIAIVATAVGVTALLRAR